MPIYEYECSSCHHHFDLIQKISEEPVKQCPQCLQNMAVRLISAAGFQLKGSGWYATDFKNKSVPGQKKETKEVSDAGSTGSSEKKTSDTKVSADKTSSDKD